MLKIEKYMQTYDKIEKYKNKVLATSKKNPIYILYLFIMVHYTKKRAKLYQEIFVDGVK